MMKTCPITIALVLGVTLLVHAADNMKVFPPAEKGMVRHVLQLPKQKDELAIKVGLIVLSTIHYFGISVD